MWIRTAHAIAWAVFVYTPAATGEVSWTVAVKDPEKGVLHVRLEIPADAVSGRERLDFAFPDAHDFNGRVSAFEARLGSEPIDPINRSTERTQRFRVPVPEQPDRKFSIAYTVDARFYPPGSEEGARRDARAILEPELGVLRTRTVFAAGRHTSMPARLRFELPESWVAVTPWDEEDGTFILPPNALGGKTEYLGIGPFALEEFRIGAAQYRIASMGRGAELVERLPALIESEQRLAGVPPRDADARHAVILLPSGFIQGGSAGRLTVVQAPNPVTLAHEIFHWWNHSELVAPESRWFSEGFTEYFAIRAALESGLISDEFAETCFADLNAEMRYLERSGAMSLAEASRRYGERQAQRLVYGKGALFAYWLDRELMEQGRALREVLPIVFADPSKRHDNPALAEAFERAFDGAVNGAFKQYVESAAPLPELGLPPATGDSGRTRFLPKE